MVAVEGSRLDVSCRKLVATGEITGEVTFGSSGFRFLTLSLFDCGLPLLVSSLGRNVEGARDTGSRLPSEASGGGV